MRVIVDIGGIGGPGPCHVQGPGTRGKGACGVTLFAGMTWK